jgi:Restriction endonuclease BamHI
VKIVREETLISCGGYAKSAAWKKTRASLHKAIREVDWPRGSGSFTIYPEGGKKRREGNGVRPIKLGLMEELERQGWKLEEPLDIAVVKRPGKLDAVLYTDYGPVALEWETGNISSSHRALNKMALGLFKGVLAAGILVVPSRELYRYLTDRVGNMAELDPYLDLWRCILCKQGVLEIVAIEHDATSTKVKRIPKGTSGRALE